MFGVSQRGDATQMVQKSRDGQSGYVLRVQKKIGEQTGIGEGEKALKKRETL